MIIHTHTYTELRTCKHLKQDQTTWDANIFIKHHLDTGDWETETKMKRKLKRKRLKFIYISSDWMISSFFSSVRSFYSLAIHHDCQTPTQPLKCLQLTLFSYRKKEKKRICSQCHGVPRSTFHLFPHFIWDERHSTKLPEVLNLSIQQSMEFFFLVSRTPF